MKKNRLLWLLALILVIGIASCKSCNKHEEEVKHRYSLDEGNGWIRNYKQINDPVIGWLASADSLRGFIRNVKPHFIHISLALDSGNNTILILSGVNKKDKKFEHVFDNGYVLIGGYTCPTCYDPGRPNDLDKRVNSEYVANTENTSPRDSGRLAGGIGRISAKDADLLIRRYLEKYPQNDTANPVGWLAPVDWLEDILDARNCRYLHISRGTKTATAKPSNVIILAGVDERYNHLYLDSAKFADKPQHRKTEKVGDEQAPPPPGDAGIETVTVGGQVTESVYPCPFCDDSRTGVQGAAVGASNGAGNTLFP